MFGMYIKRRRRRKKIRVQYKKCSFYTTKPLSESFFAEQKGKMAPQANFFIRCSSGRRGIIFLFRSSVPSGPAQVRQRNALCYHRGGEHLQHCKKQGSLDVCSHTHCIIIYSVMREVKGTRPKEAGWRLFLFIMAWYRTPRAECELFSATRGPARPPRLFPLRKTLRAR